MAGQRSSLNLNRLPGAGRLGFALAVAFALAFGAPGLTDEASVTLWGDMPKYLMNGVYMLDVLGDRPFDSIDTFMEYTRLYYARYPALTLGHHPPLLSAAEVPMFAIFGISVVSARIVIYFSFVSAVVLLYLLVDRVYGRIAAVAAAVFLATSPLTVQLGRSVLSEMPTLALIMASAYCLQRFCETERRLALAGFVTAAALSLYAKQLALFVFPAYFAAALMALGPARLLRRDVVLAVLAIGVLALPIVPMTLILSRDNVEWVVASVQHASPPLASILWRVLEPQLTLPVLALASVGLVRAFVTRDRRAVFFAVWVVGALAAVVVAGRSEPDRYGIYTAPALCALAASTVVGARRRRTATAALAVVLLAGAFQAVVASRVSLPGGAGYEEAARFVASSNPGPTVLFSGDVDTGFFIFFARKHDPDRRLAVLRADKLLTTPGGDEVEERKRIEGRDEIYGLLKRAGTRFVVIEDQPSELEVLNWLREELRSARFAERWRRPIGTRDPRLRGTDLVVYEYLEATPPDPSAELSMDLPLAGRSVGVTLSDLLERKYLR
jgi:hypothetical protein